MIRKVVMGTHVPAKLWLEEVETSCMEQIIALASLPYVFKHVAIMPDAHAGKGMPIGGVLATKGIVVPNAVGVDIGCGMCAMRTSLKASELSRETLLKVVTHIRNTIPMGIEHRSTAVDERYLPEADWAKLPFLRDRKLQLQREIGMLGGGNHFIEIQRDTATDNVWVMLHSGSRHIGRSLAHYYNRRAEFWCGKWYAETLPDLAFFPIEVAEAKDYFNEMNYCVRFASANRQMMMEEVMRGFADVCPGVEFGEIINISHNYAAWEEHFGQSVIVHSKGATRAKAGETGIIPGSMGTKSYIVEGLGNPESFTSCSHGAGRKMSRREALRTLSLEEEQSKLDAKGIIHNMTQRGLDEAPGAYKDIDVVMENEKDLVKPLVELVPLAVVKSD
ncbi:MAG: RtcB family protein [Prevotella sp.]|nr:RtcB family protein [Prevotella sp.]